MKSEKNILDCNFPSTFTVQKLIIPNKLFFVQQCRNMTETIQVVSKYWISWIVKPQKILISHQFWYLFWNVYFVFCAEKWPKIRVETRIAGALRSQFSHTWVPLQCVLIVSLSQGLLLESSPIEAAAAHILFLWKAEPWSLSLPK